MIELDGSQQKQLQAALISAFPTWQDLEQMVFHGLSVRLGTITAEGGLEQVVFELLRWAVARGRLEELIKTAIEQNSGNQELQRVATILRMSSGQFPSDVPPAAALPSIWNIPYPRNPFFIGQEAVLTRLATAFKAGQAAALSQPQAITGLGGIGKTQIAMEYAYRYHQDYRIVLWVQADNRETLMSSYVMIAHLLNLPERDAQEQAIIIQAVKHWLCTHCQWLLILDNADELALLPEFLPPSLGGHLLFTTRAQAMGRLAVRTEEIETFSPALGALFLLRRAGRLACDACLETSAPLDRTQAMQIVQKVGGLPLALDQAGAYLEETGCGLADYLHLYDLYGIKLLSERGGLVTDHPQPVATTWALSFARVRQTNPVAGEILRVCAFLQSEAIPEEILLKGGHHLGPSISLLATNPLALHQAFKALLAYSLIRCHPATRLFSVHQLVQAVIVDEMDQDTRNLWAGRVVQAVNACLPLVDYTTWTCYERYLAHAQKCLLFIEQLRLTGRAVMQLPQRISFYLHERGRYPEAERGYQKSLEIRKHVLGSEHPHLASALNGLGHVYREQGRYNEAEPLFQKALHLRLQAFGAQHPALARVYNNLAVLYRQQGKYDEAEPLFEQAMHIWKQTLGHSHPQVAWPLHGLAILYREQKKYEKSRALFQQAVSLRAQALGPQHPLVAESLNGLADLSSDQGQYAEATQWYERAITMRENALGLSHLKTAISLQGLAVVFSKQEQYAEAEPLLQRALSIRERHLGFEHPLTQETRHHYTLLLRKIGRDGEARVPETNCPSS